MADEKGLVTIIVPVYNVEEYVDDCVSSLACQTYERLDVVLVDDGSTDDSLLKCQEWARKDARVRVLRRPNGGLAAARNTGLDAARGEYVAFVDSDDWVEPKYVETLVSNMVSVDADVSIVGSRYAYSDGTFQSNYIPNVKLTLTAMEAFKLINIPGYFGVGVWDKLYKRTFFSTLRFPEDIKRSEDCRLTYTVLATSKKLIYSSECLYNYRQRESSLSNNNPYISSEPARAAHDMMDYVERVYPEIAGYARCGYLRAATGVYNSLLMANGYKVPSEWRDFQNDIRMFAKKNLMGLLKQPGISRKRKAQFLLLALSPMVYRLSLKLIKAIRPGRFE